MGIWHGERAPEHLALKASGACAQELHGTGGNGDPILLLLLLLLLFLGLLPRHMEVPRLGVELEL